jgi:integrase
MAGLGQDARALPPHGLEIRRLALSPRSFEIPGFIGPHERSVRKVARYVVGHILQLQELLGLGLSEMARSVLRIVRDLGQGIGLHVRCHGLRHTSITTAIEKGQRAGLGLDQIRAFSRHRTLATMLIYRDERDRATTERTLTDIVARTLLDSANDEEASHPLPQSTRSETTRRT